MSAADALYAAEREVIADAVRLVQSRPGTLGWDATMRALAQHVAALDAAQAALDAERRAEDERRVVAARTWRPTRSRSKTPIMDSFGRGPRR